MIESFQLAALLVARLVNEILSLWTTNLAVPKNTINNEFSASTVHADSRPEPHTHTAHLGGIASSELDLLTSCKSSQQVRQDLAWMVEAPVLMLLCVPVVQRRQWTVSHADRTDREDEAICRSASEVSFLEREKGREHFRYNRRSTQTEYLVQSVSPNIFNWKSAKTAPGWWAAPILYLQNDFWVVNCLERSFCFRTVRSICTVQCLPKKSRRTLCRLHRREHIAVHCVATSESEREREPKIGAVHF